MAITSRSKRPLNRGIPHLRDTRLIIIATEGEKTEKQYFESDLFHSLRVQVKVLGTEDGLSAPNHVINRLCQFARATDLQSDDQLWLMVDKDHWTESILSDVCSQANRSRDLKLQTAISNPSSNSGCIFIMMAGHRVKYQVKIWKLRFAKSSVPIINHGLILTDIATGIHRP